MNGIVHVHLFNNSNESVLLNRGDKVAQFIIVPVWNGQAVKVNNITNNTQRGEGGFGSTGV